LETQTTSTEQRTATEPKKLQRNGPVLLSYRGCDPDFLRQVREFIEIAGVAEVQFDSRPKMLIRTLESLQTLWALLETKQLSQEACAVFLSVKDDSSYLMENFKELEAFRVRMDFFWILERLAKLCLLAATDPTTPLKSTEQIRLVYPEAAATWLFEAAELDVLPLNLPDRVEQKHFFHWGHKYSTQGLRRWIVWNTEKIEKISDQKPSALDLSWDGFLKGFKGWLQPESIPPTELSLRVDQEDAYEKLQEEFKDLLVSLKQIAHKHSGQNLILWCEDPQLETRMALTHDELYPPEEDAGD